MDSHLQLGTQHVEFSGIGTGTGSDDEIRTELRQERENLASDQLPQAALQAIALHDRMPMLRNDDANPWMTQKGSEDPNLEVFGSSSLPFTQNLLQIRSPGETQPPGIGGALRRRRTWLAAGR